MAHSAQPVSGVYEKNEGSDIWYIRYRLHGHLVRKNLLSLLRAKQTAKTTAEMKQEVKENQRSDRGCSL